MRMQDSQANCGPFAVRNALAALGIDRSVEELEKLLGCTATHGTTGTKMWKGLLSIAELNPVKIDESRQDVAHLRLRAALDAGRPVVCCVDNNEHYICAIGLLGSGRVLIADSADTELVLSLDWSQLMGRWRSGLRRAYWGIAL